MLILKNCFIFEFCCPNSNSCIFFIADAQSEFLRFHEEASANFQHWWVGNKFVNLFCWMIMMIYRTPSEFFWRFYVLINCFLSPIMFNSEEFLNTGPFSGYFQAVLNEVPFFLRGRYGHNSCKSLQKGKCQLSAIIIMFITNDDLFTLSVLLLNSDVTCHLLKLALIHISSFLDELLMFLFLPAFFGGELRRLGVFLNSEEVRTK